MDGCPSPATTLICKATKIRSRASVLGAETLVIEPVRVVAERVAEEQRACLPMEIEEEEEETFATVEV